MDEQPGKARRMRGRWLAGAVLAVIVVASILHARLPRGSAHAGDSAVPAPASHAEDQEEGEDDAGGIDAGPATTVPLRPRNGVQGMGQDIPAADLPPPGTPVREAIRVLEPLVEQGRADAAHVLAMELVRCQRARNLGSDDVIRERLLRRFRGRNGQNPATDAELDAVAREIDRLGAERDRCAGIDDELYSSRLDLLEQAAKAGNTDAMLDYVDWGLQDIAGYDGVLRNFDEVARRRTLAGDFLIRALSLGDCRALGVMAEAYAGGRGRRNWVFTANPYLAAVYGEAAALAPGAAPASSVALAALDAQQQANAREQALRLVQRHCAR